MLNKSTSHILVNYFYSNFNFDNSNYFISSHVKRKIIEFDFSFFDQILDIPSNNDEYFNHTY